MTSPTITFSFAVDDLKLVEDLIRNMRRATSPGMSQPAAPEDETDEAPPTVAEPASKKKRGKRAAATVADEDPSADDEPESGVPTDNELKKAVRKRIEEDGIADVKEIFVAHGGTRLSEIPAANKEALLAALEGLV